ncbi:MAG: DNA ligase [Thiotrichales bacterium]|nr:DNA ligase [Thiotrichales bacterium]
MSMQSCFPVRPAFWLGVLLLGFMIPIEADLMAAERPALFLANQAELEQLGDLIEKEANNPQVQWVMSRKYDGVRAFWDGQQLLSRSGLTIKAPSWFLDALPPFAIDGELWIATGAFAQVNGLLKRTSITPENELLWRQVRYWIFEVPNYSGNLFARLQPLASFLQQQPDSPIRIVEQRVVKRSADLQRFYQALLALGGEGVIVRDAALPYLTGRLSRVYKLKPYHDAECIVRAYKPGKGRLQGKVGALVCELIAEQQARLFPKLPQHRPVLIALGSGLSDQQRSEPPLIGSLVTFRYRGLTERGLPRFAVFMRERALDAGEAID